MVYPNPFSRLTKISFGIGHSVRDISATQYAGLKIYDVCGRLVRFFPINRLTNQPVNHIVWNGTDNSGKKVSSGVYFIEFKVGEFSETRKLLLIK